MVGNQLLILKIHLMSFTAHKNLKEKNYYLYAIWT